MPTRNLFNPQTVHDADEIQSGRQTYRKQCACNATASGPQMIVTQEGIRWVMRVHFMACDGCLTPWAKVLSPLSLPENTAPWGPA